MKKLKNLSKVTKVLSAVVIITILSTSIAYSWDYNTAYEWTFKKIGIGTSSPNQKLDIYDGGIGFSSTTQWSGDKKLYSPADGLLEWMTHDWATQHAFAVSHQGDRRVFLNTSGNSYLTGGNVGIGFTAPATKLHVLANTFHAFRLSSIYAGTAEWDFALGDNGLGMPGTLSIGYIGDNTGIGGGPHHSVFVLKNNGNVGIGTTSPQAKLHVAGDVKIDGNIVANNLQGVNLTVQNLTALATVSANNYSCSDRRYKKDIVPVSNALEKLSLLNGVYYNWKTADFKDKGFSGKRDMGFIAQDLEKVFPEVVYTDSKGYKSVAYSKLTAVIVEALKTEHKLTLSIQKSTSALEEKVASLQQENAQLKQQIASLREMSEKVAQLENMMKLYSISMQ